MAPWAHGDVRSLAVEREWDGWDDFFKSGSLMLAAVSLQKSCLAILNVRVAQALPNLPAVLGKPRWTTSSMLPLNLSLEKKFRTSELVGTL